MGKHSKKVESEMEKEEKSHEDASSVDTASEKEKAEGAVSKEEERRKEERRKTERRSGQRRKEKEPVEDPRLAELRERVNEKEEDLLKLRGEADSLKDLLQRRQADFENFKKRNTKMLEDTKKFAIRDFATDIIMINDDLLRAIEASGSVDADEGSCDESHSSFVQGVSMISKRIEETFNNYGIEEIAADGQPFDPNFHEAVEIEMSEKVDVDTVTFVHQKGFRIEDMVVRSARVKVAKPVPRQDASNGGSNGAAEETKG